MNRNYYADKLKKDAESKPRVLTSQNAHTDTRLIDESLMLSHKLLQHVRNTMYLNQAYMWMLGMDMYVQDSLSSYRGKYSNVAKLRRGRIVEVDVFGQVGTEQKKNRPAVVLKDMGTGIIVAMIGGSAYDTLRPYHVSLEAKIDNQGYVSKNCGVKLDQIRYMDKGRILRLKGTITSVDKLNEMDDKLTALLSPFWRKQYDQKMMDQQEKIKELEEQLQASDQIIAELRSDKERLLKKLDQNSR